MPLPYLTVRANEGEYARKWRLLPGGEERTYRMTADRSRVVLSPQFGGGNAEDIVVPRGLIKWYCSTGGGDCKKKKTKTGARIRSKKHEFDEREDPATASVDQKMFFLEISPDCAFGPGAIELICLEEKVDVMRWVNDRFFPSKSEAALGGLARCFAAAWKKVKGFFASILPACCGGGISSSTRSVGRRQSAASSMFQVVERRGSAAASSIMQMTSIRRRRRSQNREEASPPPPPKPAAVQISVEEAPEEEEDSSKGDRRKRGRLKQGGGQDSLEVDEGEDHLSRTQSLNVKLRRKESMKKIRRGVSKMWKSLSHNARLQTDEDSSRLSTYRSFEEIDDCFSFEDQDCDFCNELDNSSQEGGGGLDKLDTLHRRRDNDKIDRIFDPRRQSSFMELPGSGEQQQQQQDEGLGFETISVVEDEEEDSDDVKNAWSKPPSLDQEADSHLPPSAKPSTFGRRSPFLEKKDSSSSRGVTVAFDESDGTVIVVEDMDIYRVPRNKVEGGGGGGGGGEGKKVDLNAEAGSSSSPSPVAGGGGTSDEYDKCDMSSSSSSSEGEAKFEKRVRSGSSASKGRYVDQSASLLSLRSSAAVTSAIARFEHSAAAAGEEADKKKPDKTTLDKTTSDKKASGGKRSSSSVVYCLH